MSNYLDELKKKMSGALNTPDVAKPDQIDILKKEEPPLEPEKKPETIADFIKKKPLETPKKHSGTFFLSQSLIKEITNHYGDYKEELCPRLIYEKFIQKKFRYVTDPMLQGIFGETMVLGGGAKGQQVTDLPRHKKTGKKLTAQLNIEEQAVRFPMWCASKGISVIPGINTQVPIVKQFKEGSANVLIATEFDLFPTPFLNENEYKLAIVDVKYTGDINNRHGNFCWGAPEYIDHIQADMAYWLIQDFDMELNLKFNPDKEDVYRMIFNNQNTLNMIKNEDVLFVYFVIGYKAQPLDQQILFLNRTYRDPSGTLQRQLSWKERARKTLAQLAEWKEQGWPPNENGFCPRCPVAEKNGGYCKTSTLRKV